MSTQLFIGRLPQGCRSRDLEDIFYKYGKMTRCDVKQGVKMCKFCCLFDQPIICRETPFIDSPVPTAYGFIEYEDPRDAEDAQRNEHGRDLRGARIVVEWARGPGYDYRKDRYRDDDRRDRGRDRRRDDSDRHRSRSRSRSRGRRSRSRSRDRDYDRRQSRSRDRDYGRKRSRSRDRDYDRKRSRSRDRDRRRSRSHSRDRDRDRRRSRSHSRDRDNDRRRSRSRSRS